ncbi:MAG: uroporphyrinogen decarboxylase family protein [Spirochaetales bacterium]|nr:uroporphyrinogen decarboxylase family protein [Spirochaetales bacterium]
MTPRERVLAAINHKEPDRVPVDLGATPSSGISAIAHARLMKHLGWDDKTLIYDVVQQLAQPGERLIDRLGVDVLDIGRTFNEKDSDWYGISLPGQYKAFNPAWFRPVQDDSGSWISYHKDGTPIAAMPEGATFYDQTIFPWLDGYPDSRKGMEESLDEAMDKILWANMVHSPWDHAGEADFWQTLRQKTLKLREESDKALLVVCGSNLFEWGTFLRRMDNFLMDLYIDQDNVAILMELLMERHMKTLEKVCDAVGDVVDVLRFGDDLGMDSGPFMGMEIYTELFHDHRKKLCSYVHDNSGMKTFLHSCGSIYQYIPSLIDEGIDIINPLQTNCLDMEPEKVKAEFGKDMCFWGGGMDPRVILNNGTPAMVRDEVKRRLDILSPGGGYVFNNIHNIMPDVPPENILALFDAVLEYRIS